MVKHTLKILQDLLQDFERFEHFVNTWHYKAPYPSILTENENKKRIFYVRPMHETPDQNKAQSHFLQRKQSHIFLLFFKVFELILTMKISDLI